jgi:hypothetical protein
MRYLIFIISFLFLGCNGITNLDDSNKEVVVVDSVYIIVQLESNMDTIQNTASLSHNGRVICTLKESVSKKIFVPEATLEIEWSTRHISNSDSWPYVYWLELDGSGWSDTTVVANIVPVDGNRYNIRGTKLFESF